MAASMKNHARVCLTFDSGEMESCWILVKYKETPLISDLCERINSRFILVKSKKKQVVLRLQGSVLPNWESSELLQDDDRITVSVERISSSKCTVNEVEDVIDTVQRKNRKRKASSTEDIDECQPYEKKKKNKGKQTEDTHKSSNKKSKTESSSEGNSDVEAREQIEAIQNSPIDIPVVTVEIHKVTDGSNNTEQIDANLEDIADETPNSKKKRKRIRKHRKKKSVPEDGDKFIENKEKFVTESYKGRDIEKGEMFFGSIPDKLVSPKYYRHGYRNLNVYRPDPNKHTKFDSDEETTVKENTEQYNFLSSTKLVEERELYHDANGGVNSESVGNEFDKKENETKAVRNEHKTDKQPSVNGHQMIIESEPHQNKEGLVVRKSDRFQWLETDHTDTSIGYHSDTINTNNYQDFPFKYPNSVPRPARKTTSNTSVYTTAVSQYTDSEPKHVRNHVIPSPTQLTRKTLSSGASVFTRQRPGRRQQQQQHHGHFEMSKEDQLNTVSTNVSTIFVNPVLKDSTRNDDDVTDKLTNHKPSTENEIQDKLSMKNQVENEQSTKKSDSSNISSSDERGQRGTTTTELTENTIEYAKLPPLKGELKPGDKIVYKVLEISETCIPEISDFREAEVLSVDRDQMVELRNTSRIETKKNKFHVEIEDENEVLTNTQQSGTMVQLHVSSLLDIRMVQSR